jgi:hypothetical protein
MQAIADGKVKAIATGRLLGDMIFRQADVVEYFGTPLLEVGEHFALDSRRAVARRIPRRPGAPPSGRAPT